MWNSCAEMIPFLLPNDAVCIYSMPYANNTDIRIRAQVYAQSVPARNKRRNNVGLISTLTAR